MLNQRIYAFMLAALWLAAQAGPAAAQVKPGPTSTPRGPIAISADRLETDDDAGVASFIGAVVARQGTMTITCDLMKVFYTSAPEVPAPEASAPPAPDEASPDEAAADRDQGGGSPLSATSREIDRVEAFGHVKMVDGDRMAVGGHALYLAKSEPRRLILTEDARVWQGRDSLTGHKVTYFLDEKRSLVESERRQRVRTVIHDGTSLDGAP